MSSIFFQSLEQLLAVVRGQSGSRAFWQGSEAKLVSSMNY